MEPPPYVLEQVLRVARQHPFYNEAVVYPLSREKVIEPIARLDSTPVELDEFPVTTKNELSRVVFRLLGDKSTENAYRHHCYTTITGGGFKRGTPLLWLTDSIENRHNRAAAGNLLRAAGVVEPTDVVLNLHVSGHFYRSLDMTSDILEHAGATVLPAGSDMPSDMVVEALIQYCITCLAGPVTELIRVALHISHLPEHVSQKVKIGKLFYTSEPLSVTQERFLHHVFGPVPIYSGLGSAEIGFWGVGNPIFAMSPGSDFRDYLYDTRNMIVEILPIDKTNPDTAEINQPGRITVTSLQRLRNPLVRYMSGDIGSVHPLPEAAHRQLPEDEAAHYRIIRMYGRDPHFTFTWGSTQFDYQTICNTLERPGWNVLQWQLIIEDGPAGEALEIWILRGYGLDGEVPDLDLVENLKQVFLVTPDVSFNVKLVQDFSAFERSGTGRKVVRFVDKRIH